MKKLNRRKFLKGSAAVGAAVGMKTTLVNAQTSAPTYESRVEAAVIGSGFGGSVAALRLGEAGLSTALIERGQYWQHTGPDSFPTVANIAGDGRTTWLDTVDGASGMMPVPRYTGMLERVQGDTITGSCGAGLGGGSLVYGGVLLKPKQEVFEQVLPSISFYEMDTIYYPRVLEKVSGGPIPDDILNAPNYSAKKAFIKAATEAGMDVVKGHVGFDWDIIRRELSGELAPAASIGEYVFSCNSGAKNTLDKNYISDAVATGNVDVYTLHNVDTITQVGSSDQYRVHCDVLNEFGDIVQRHIIHCNYVFMAAGSLNTSKLLLKAKAQGDLTGLNDQVGQNWGSNGDELMGRMVFDPSIIGVQGGPASIAAHDSNNPIKPVTFMHSPSNQQLPGLPAYLRLELQFAMSVPDKLGYMSYDAVNDKPYIHWPKAENALDAQAHLASLVKLSAVPQGYLPGDVVGSQVWHPLGGCVMGQACDERGEVYGQPNLFVVDGSAMPGSTGAANPSLTIAANAERIMEALIPELVDGGHNRHRRHYGHRQGKGHREHRGRGRGHHRGRRHHHHRH